MSGSLVLFSVVVFFIFGLKLSADFTEGTLLAIKFKQPVAEELKDSDKAADEAAVVETETADEEAEVAAAGKTLSDISKDQVQSVVESFKRADGLGNIGKIDVKKSSDGIIFIKLGRLEDGEADLLLNDITTKLGDFEILQSRNVSPIYAKTFRDKAVLAIAVSLVMIILYITFAFRKVSRGIKSWKLGIAAIIALFHDVSIVVGVFVILGVIKGVEVDALFITAILSVLGISINDTIVVFDRVRENLLIKHYTDSFEVVVEKSVQQTLARSINTSFTIILVLTSLLIFGASEIFYFVLALAAGVFVGTYSSIFVATPLLTYFQKSENK